MKATRRQALGAGLGSLAAIQARGEPPQDLASSQLPGLPSLEDVASDRISHGFRDGFNPPGLSNQWGHAQVSHSPTGITAISFPPLACCGLLRGESHGLVNTCEMIWDGRLAVSRPQAVTSYQWFPHCVERETELDGIHISSRAFLPPSRTAVAQEIVFTNRTAARHRLSVEFVMRAHVTARTTKPWDSFVPVDPVDLCEPDPGHGRLVFRATASRAVSIQGFAPHPRHVRQRRILVFPIEVDRGARLVLRYINVLDEDEAVAKRIYDELLQSFSEQWQANQRAAAARLHAALTPGNTVYSGHLPRLNTRSRALWRLYHCGLNSLLYNRVDSPRAAIAPAYVTLRPTLAATRVYPWDFGMTPLSLSLLDPEAMRRMLEIWAVEYRDRYYATDYLTGRGTGSWYSANNWSVLRCADSYLRTTGSLDWLDKRIEGRSILDHLKAHAVHWRTLDKRKAGLADYGTPVNLLEVVTTYKHGVPAFNAANVYGLRLVAALLELKGRDTEAGELRAEARQLAERIIRLLYVDGKGYWRCLQPDGTYQEVRHAMDFLMVLQCMEEDLPPRIVEEMRTFFYKELWNPIWMHALSPADVDSSMHGRPDHSWRGAYPAWPAMSATALLRIDPGPRVADWVRGLARSANQGTFGQAHLVPTAMAPENGGAAKAASRIFAEHSLDWSEAVGGSFIDLIIEGVFGASLKLDGGITVASQLDRFDPGASLVGLRHREKDYTITRTGPSL